MNNKLNLVVVCTGLILLLSFQTLSQEETLATALVSQNVMVWKCQILRIERRKLYTCFAREHAGDDWEWLLICVRIKPRRIKTSIEEIVLSGPDGKKYDFVPHEPCCQYQTKDPEEVNELVFHVPEDAKLKSLKLDLKVAKFSFALANLESKGIE